MNDFEEQVLEEEEEQFEEEPAAEGAAEQPENYTGEEPEAEGAAKKPEQTPEERARWADLDRKQKLEQERAEKAAIIGALEAVGIQAGNGYEAAEAVRAMAEKAKQDAEKQELARRMQELEQEAEETGVPLEILKAQESERRAQEEAQRILQLAQQERARAVFEADRVIVSTIDPKFFDTASEQQMKAFGALRVSGFDPITALSMVKGAPATKQDPGTGHMTATKGGSASNEGEEIPKGELSLWRDMFPEETTAQLKRRYNRSLKRQGL